MYIIFLSYNGGAHWSINYCIKGVYVCVHLFPIGGEPAVGKGAHSNLGAQAWLTLPPLGPQFFTYTAPQDWSHHGNDLEWSSQGLQLCDWWWEGRGRGTYAHKREKKEKIDSVMHTHTHTHGPEVTVSHLTATLWLLSEASRADAASVPRDRIQWNLEAACSAQLKGQFLISTKLSLLNWKLYK